MYTAILLDSQDKSTSQTKSSKWNIFTILFMGTLMVTGIYLVHAGLTTTNSSNSIETMVGDKEMEIGGQSKYTLVPIPFSECYASGCNSLCHSADRKSDDICVTSSSYEFTFDYEDDKNGWEGANDCNIPKCPADISTVSDSLLNTYCEGDNQPGVDNRLNNCELIFDVYKIQLTSSLGKQSPSEKKKNKTPGKNQSYALVPIPSSQCAQSGCNSPCDTFVLGCVRKDPKIKCPLKFRDRNCANSACAWTSTPDVCVTSESEVYTHDYEDPNEVASQANDCNLPKCPYDLSTISASLLNTYCEGDDQPGVDNRLNNCEWIFDVYQIQIVDN